MTIESFLGKEVVYDRFAQMIFAKQKDGGMQLILDVRAWGAIQHLFEDEDEAEAFQDQLGHWVVDAINQKLKAN